ncbi:hypothetical protein DY000_02060861 [Brassica cretica]|uniref:Uncharacterized protein n=1 Tax=Brassica cretica TaxID=69181 RepID=A0ABQ7AR20_BRACR|nr:hypothetical protein DY000_02060861 [Brassica cretica]
MTINTLREDIWKLQKLASIDTNLLRSIDKNPTSSIYTHPTSIDMANQLRSIPPVREFLCRLFVSTTERWTSWFSLSEVFHFLEGSSVPGTELRVPSSGDLERSLLGDPTAPKCQMSSYGWRLSDR